jgi:hypothetical protein
MSIGKLKEVKFLKDLIGRKLPSNMFGAAGREFENILESDYNVNINRGEGPDDLMFGVEFKTRDLDAISPQTVGTMKTSDIVKTPYKESLIFKKFQQQIRIKTKNNVIVEADLYDFRPKHIQEKIEEAYEYARGQLIKDSHLRATLSGPDSTGYWGYFENSNNRENSQSFRINLSGMNDYETMAKSTFTQIFDYDD